MKRTVIFTMDNGARIKAKISRRGFVETSRRGGTLTKFNVQGVKSHTLLHVDIDHVIALEVLKAWWLR